MIPRRRPLSLVKQMANLRVRHRSLAVRLRGDRLDAEGWIRGNGITRRYHVRIEYRLGYHPRTTVIEPPLEQLLPDQPVAHTNGPNEPCLYTKAHPDWRATMYLGDSVVPWLMEWLVCYELWRATGSWFGGGTLPAGYGELPRRHDEPAE
jgi:hypothetical protein